jgi:hypothetical protein
VTEGPLQNAEGLCQLVLNGLGGDMQPLRHFCRGESFESAQLKYRAAPFRELLSHGTPEFVFEEGVLCGTQRIRIIRRKRGRDIGRRPLPRAGMAVLIAQEVQPYAVHQRLKTQRGLQRGTVLPDAEKCLLHDIMCGFDIAHLKGDAAQEGRLIPGEECLECIEVTFFQGRYELLFILPVCHSFSCRVPTK